MRFDIDLTHVSSIIPEFKERIVSEVTYLDGRKVIVNVKPLTVVEWVADRNMVAFKRVKEMSQKLNFRKKDVPIPSGLMDAFLPFHLAGEQERCYKCNGFCNVANQRVDVLPVPDESRRSILRLQDGRELLVDVSPKVMSKYLASAIATHRRYIQEVMETMDPGAAKAFMAMMALGFPKV